MRKLVRAIITRDDKLLVMKRYKYGDTYYTLIGGGVDPGETPEEALVREIDEETSLIIEDFRKVIVEAPWGKYGEQHIYLCEDPGGDVVLRTDAIEAKLNKNKNNTYKPMWLNIERLPMVKF